MRVLVTNPPWPGPGYGARSDVRWPHKRSDKYLEYPIYLAYIVAVLEKAGFEVEFLDAVLEELSINDFAEKVKEINPEMVVIECSTPSIEYDLSSAKAIKKILKKAFVVLVGSHPTFFHKEIISENEAIDVICRGEFDFTVRDVALVLSQQGDLRGVKGVTYRDGGSIHVNEDRPLIQNLDELPFPARHIVKSKHYRQGTFAGKHCTAMVSSRGCPYHCTYCLWPGTLYGHRVRARSPLNVVEEIEEVVRDYHIDEIYFDDDSLALDRKRMLEICRLIRERHLKVEWISQCRADSMDEEVVESMKQAGCRYIRFGVESGSQRMLQAMKKGVTLDKIKRAFDLCRRMGIKTQAFFLFGIPGETEDSIRETIEFAKELRPDSAQFAVVIPHPGTELYRICQDNGWLRYNSWEDFSAGNCLIETEHLSRREIERARIQAYREFYFRPSYIFRTAFKLRNLGDTKSVIKSAASIIDRIGYFKERSRC